MSYTPTTWSSGDLITSTKLNKIEQGLAAASDLDSTLTVSGKPADSKAVGDEVAELKNDFSDNLNDIRTNIFPAILDCFKNVVYASNQGADYYRKLEMALNGGYEFYDYIALKTSGTAAANSAIFADIELSSDYIYSTTIYYPNSAFDGFVPFFTNRISNIKNIGFFAKPSTTQCGYWFANTDTTTIITGINGGVQNNIVFNPVGTSEDYPEKATITINGVEYDTGSSATGIIWQPKLCLFGSATGSDTSNGAPNIGRRIGRFTIKDKLNNLVADLVPAFNGDYYGFLDMVSKRFYYNEAFNDIYQGGNW